MFRALATVASILACTALVALLTLDLSGAMRVNHAVALVLTALASCAAIGVMIAFLRHEMMRFLRQEFVSHDQHVADQLAQVVANQGRIEALLGDVIGATADYGDQRAADATIAALRAHMPKGTNGSSWPPLRSVDQL